MNPEDEAEMDLGDKKWTMIWIVIKDMCYQIKKTATIYRKLNYGMLYET
jgi:hypothetical protein